MVGAGAGPSDREKGMEVGRIVARGATFLFLAQIASVVVGITGSIILIRLLVSPGVYGFISVATTIPGLVMIGDVTGVNAALTKYLSQYNAERNHAAIWSSFWTALAVKLLTGAALSAVAYLAAGPISVLINKPGTLEYFRLAAPLPLVWVTQVNLKSTLLALDASRGYSVLQIVNEALLSLPPIVAVLLGYGAPGALVAMVIGNYVYLVLGIAFCVRVIAPRVPMSERKLNFRLTVRKLVRFGAPLGFSKSYGTFTGQVTNLVIARFVPIDLYGLYSVAQSATGFLNYVSDPIVAMLLPAYSRISSLDARDLMKSLSAKTARYETAIGLPVTLFFMIFARPFVVLLFGSEYAEAGLLVTILSAATLTVGLAADPFNAFLTSKAFSKFIGLISILSSTVGASLAILVVPTLGLVGYLICMLFGFVPGYILLNRKASRELGLSPPLRLVSGFYFAAAAAAAVTIPAIFVALPPIVLVLFGLVVLPLAYVLFAVLFRAVNSSDPRQLRDLLATQPFISAVLRPMISFLDLLIRTFQRTH